MRMTEAERWEIVDKNTGLIFFMIKKKIGFLGNYMKRGVVAREDLIQEGKLAIYNATRFFKKNKGRKFVTYACSSIYFNLIRYCIDNGFRTFRVPVWLIERIRGAFSDHGRALTIKEMVDKEIITDRDAWKLVNSEFPAMLDERMNEDDPNSATVGEIVTVKEDNPKEDLEHIKFTAHKLLNQLDPLDRSRISLYFGIGCERLSIPEIAKLRKTTKQNESHKILSIIEKLKALHRRDECLGRTE